MNRSGRLIISQSEIKLQAYLNELETDLEKIKC